MTQGFHAHPRITTGPPLPLGYTSCAEYLTVEVRGNIPQGFDAIVNKHLPDGFEVFGFAPVQEKSFSLNGRINLAAYRISWDHMPSTEEMKTHIEAFMQKNSHRLIRKRKDKTRELDIRPHVRLMRLTDRIIDLELSLGQQGTARVEEVVQAILPAYEECPDVLRAERIGLYIDEGGRRFTPLQFISGRIE
jgi:radical SAM-linked protein